MKKLKLIFAVLALILGGANSASAQSIWTSGAVAADDGEYYLYNVGANCYLNQGGTYTTHAIVDGHGVVVKLDKKEGEGIFSIYTGVNSKYLGPGCYTDETEANWTLEEVSLAGYENVYKLKASDNKYLYWTGGGAGFWGNEVLSNADITGGQENNFYWMLISKSTRENFASASAVSPLEITYFVSNPDFEYQIQDNPWQNDEGEEGMKPWTGDFGKTTQGWTNTNFWRQNSSQTFANGIFFEKWDGNGLTTADKIYQNVTLQAGNYRLTCTGHARCTEFYLYAEDKETHITDAGTYTVDFTVSKSGSVEIGAKIKEGGSGDWVAFDNVRLYCKGLNYVQLNKETIAANKGDLTSLVNGTFQDNADGWSGGGRVSNNRTWHGASANGYYERSSDGTMTCTVANMPVGSYKVVAAARTYAGGKLKAQVADGDYGTELTGVGDTQSAASEINTNGVQMPYSGLGGFTTDVNGHNWQWITATGTLAADGNLVINFVATGNSWMAIDDVHLYCTELDGTSYTYTIDDSHTAAGDKVVTADIILSNPNTIITSSASITTAANAALNNNLVGTHIAQLILYDGENNTFSMSTGNYTINSSYGAAKFYRQFTKDQYCTVCLPFTPAIGTGTYYKPVSFVDGVLTLSAVADKDLKPNTPYILKPAGSYSDLWNNNNGDNSEKYNVKYTGVRPATSISDDAMWFTGTYEKIDNIGSWSGTYYVLGTDNNLHKVAGEVSVNPFRAYFFISGESGARSTIRVNFDGTTGVENVEAVSEAAQKEGKFIENGKLVIVKNGKKFNANGQLIY